jgi:acetylornithine deacetylase/succinyl-diaminopimelate desuccinylase-like protein
MNRGSIEREAISDLQELIRFKTVNPPGNEGPAARFLFERLEDAGLRPRLLECEGRPNVVVRLQGDRSRDGGPLLLTGHLDVVPVEEEAWTHPPFGAEVEGEYLYGRGAVDMKHMVAMCLTIACQLAREEIRLGRDIILAFVSDEEEGCRCGSRFLVESHPEEVRAECMIGETGGFSMDVNRKRYYPIQVAEKGRCRIRLTARGEPGHGSIPHQENAVLRLAQALIKLGQARLPQHRVRTVERFVQELARTQGFPASWILPCLLDPLIGGALLEYLLEPSVANPLAATLSNTVVPTILEAGGKINVIPGRAVAHLDGRTLPGQTGEDLVREMRRLVGDAIDIDILEEHPGRENSGTHPLLATLTSTLKDHDPQGIPIPCLATGFTDAAYFGRIVPHCFGFSPVRFPASDRIRFEKLLHGHDERIHLPGFLWGLRVLDDAVRRHCVREPVT